MQPEVTSARQMKGLKIAEFLPELSELLNPGETAFLIGSTDTWWPASDTFVLTTHRLLITMGKNLVKSNAWYEISGSTTLTEKRGLRTHLRADQPYDINRLKPEDRAALQAALEVFPRMGSSSASWNAWVLRRTALVSPGHPSPSAVPTGFPLPPVDTAPADYGPAMPFDAAPPYPTQAPAQPAVEDPYAYPQDSPTVEAMPDRAELLDQLGALHRYGVLTTDEFSAVTARLLSRER